MLIMKAGMMVLMVQIPLMMVMMKIGLMMVMVTMMMLVMEMNGVDDEDNDDCNGDEVDGSDIKDDFHDNIADDWGGSHVDATLFLVLLYCDLNQTYKLLFTGNC